MKIMNSIRSLDQILEAINNNTQLSVKELEAIVSDQMHQFVVTEVLSPQPNFQSTLENCKILLKFAGVHQGPMSYVGDNRTTPVVPQKDFLKLISLVQN